MSDVTRLLQSIQDGDQKAIDELLPLVYNELRRLAAARMKAERPDHTLQPTALVHEAYLRLVGAPMDRPWENHGQFFAAAAEAMRRILVESARRRRSLKRGGDRTRAPLDELALTDSAEPHLLLDVDDALDRFALIDRHAAELVKLRMYAGLSVEEAAAVLGISRTTAYENWTWAKAWFACEMSGTDSEAQE